MRTVVFIQGGGEGAYDEDAALVSSLRSELGDSIRVEYPRMPAEGDPDAERWVPAIRAAVEGADTVVGHSIGGYLLLRAGIPASAQVVALIAPPYPGGDADWTFDGFEMPAQLPTQPVYLYASEDDEIVPFAHRDLWAAAVPGSRVRTTSGGHQLGDDLADVARDIRSVLA